MTYATDVAAAKADVAAKQAAFTSASQNLQMAQSNVATAQEQVVIANDALEVAEAKLQNLLDNPPPVEPPPTTTGKPVVGATVGGDDGGLKVLADARRCYDLTGAGPTEAIARVKPGGIIWVNYKGIVTETWLESQLRTLEKQAAAKALKILVTSEHESDIKDVIPLDIYHKNYDLLEKVIVKFPTMQPIVCLTGFKGDKSVQAWEERWRPNHKWIGFDHYNKGHQLNGEPMSTPVNNYGPLLAWAGSKGKPVCIGETGVGDDAVPGSVIKTQQQWYAEHRKFVLNPANKIMVCCAFDSGLAKLNSTEAKAWYGV